MNKLFVYGIFLDPARREEYGMTNPAYAVVRGYKLKGFPMSEYEEYEDICEARFTGNDNDVMTGLVVEVQTTFPLDNWPRIDRLEGGYDRVKVVTTGGKNAWMYVGR